MEKDEIRRHDSFQAFEEICSIAEQKEVITHNLFTVLLSISSLSPVWFCLFYIILNFDCIQAAFDNDEFTILSVKTSELVIGAFLLNYYMPVYWENLMQLHFFFC